MTSPSPATRRDLLFLTATALFFCLWNLGGGSLASWDEAQYAQVAKEIVRSGDWVYLRFLGNDWYVKPPLALWATAVFFKFFGVHEFAARLYAALTGIGTVLMTYVLGRFLFDRRTALFGAGILLSTTDFLHFSRWGMMDVPNLFFFTSAIVFFLRAMREGRDDPEEGGSGRSDAWFLAFAVAFASAFMTKGPVVILVPVLFVLYSLWTGEWGYARSPLFWASFVLAAIFILPWHAAVYFHNREAFVHDFVGTHWLRRSSEAIEGHAAGWYFYVRSLINKFHPWVVVLPFALPFAVAGAFRGSKAMKFITLWTAVVFLFFTFAVSTKLRWYTMPMYPALALAIGAFLARWIPDAGIPWAKLVFVAVLGLHFPFSSAMDHDYSSGIKNIASAVKQQAGENESVVLYNFHDQPAAVFYWDRSVRYADSPAELDRILAAGGRVVLVAQASRYAEEGEMLRSKGFTESARSAGPKDPVVLLLYKAPGRG